MTVIKETPIVASDGIKIFGFLQIKNEVKSGHLVRFLEVNGALFDGLYVIDDGSDDDTPLILEAAGAIVVRNELSNFRNEQQNKRILLERLLIDAEPGDAILRLDADEVMYASRAELLEVVETSFSMGYDSISFHHLNLWRSDTWFRVDDNYDSMNPVRIWKVSDRIYFPNDLGLHGQMHPIGLSLTLHHTNFPVFHYGFASEDLIISKYVQYWRNWQDGYALNRLISESDLTLRPVHEYPSSLGSRWGNFNGETSDEPLKKSPRDWANRSNLAKEKWAHERELRGPNVTIVSLIFKGVDWLEFQYGEMLKLQREFERGDVELLFVANDATDAVKLFLTHNLIPHVVLQSRVSPDEWYINSVYRAYNFGIKSAKGKQVLLVNSDMAYSEGFLRTMIKSSSSNLFLTSRLVERGVLASGEHGIEKDFGSHPSKFSRRLFERFALGIASPESIEGGLFMPLLADRKSLLELGGFPEGNLDPNSLDSYLAGQGASIANQGEPVVPGDRAFFNKAARIGIQHQTNLASVAYHFQEGELRGKKSKTPLRSGIGIVNDSYIGINGEEVLWGRLIQRLESEGIRVIAPALKRPKTRLGYLFAPLSLALSATKALSSRPVRVTFSNASYSFPLLDGSQQVTLTQDRITRTGLRFLQKLKLANSRILTNAPDVFEQNLKRGAEIVSIDVASLFLESQEDQASATTSTSKPTMIFVGALNETKGWSQVESAIQAHPDLNWTIVSKYPSESARHELNHFANVTFKFALSAEQVKREMISSDYLVSASPYETQHLASLEAICLNVPVLITPTGLLGHSNRGVHEFGIVGESLSASINLIKSSALAFEPKAYAEKIGLFKADSERIIRDVLIESLRASFLPDAGKLASFASRLRSALLNKFRYFYRSILMPALLRLRLQVPQKRGEK